MTGSGDRSEMRTPSGLLRIHRPHCIYIDTEFSVPARCSRTSLFCSEHSIGLYTSLSRCHAPYLTSPPPFVDPSLSVPLHVLVGLDCFCRSLSFFLPFLVAGLRQIRSSSPLRIVLGEPSCRCLFLLFNAVSAAGGHLLYAFPAPMYRLVYLPLSLPLLAHTCRRGKRPLRRPGVALTAYLDGHKQYTGPFVIEPVEEKCI